MTTSQSPGCAPTARPLRPIPDMTVAMSAIRTKRVIRDSRWAGDRESVSATRAKELPGRGQAGLQRVVAFVASDPVRTRRASVEIGTPDLTELGRRGFDIVGARRRHDVLRPVERLDD